MHSFWVRKKKRTKIKEVPSGNCKEEKTEKRKEEGACH
jgi:hypothetical protein